jgi:predicted RNA-binding Zn-ribbon protein involved in translation (DUF1610 family)
MRRVAFISGVIAVGILTCWIVSERRDDVFGLGGDHALLIGQAKGAVLVGLGDMVEPKSHHHVLQYHGGSLIGNVAWSYFRFGEVGLIAWYDIYGDNDVLNYGRHGFFFARSESPDDEGRKNWCIIFPHWTLLTLAAVLPGASCVRQLRSANRRRHGLCPSCGYDLCATQYRCPECGTAVP